MRYKSFWLFNFIYFISLGFSVFLPKYYGEINLSDTQIALLSALPTILCTVLTPAMGMLTDRISIKKYALLLCMVVMGIAYMFVEMCPTFLTLMIPVMICSLFGSSVIPINTTIAIEYCAESKKPFGPIRLSGSIGYQIGALVVGLVFAGSLKGLNPMMGGMTLIASLCIFLMPNIEGHQHTGKKVPISVLLKDKTIRTLLIIIFFATIPTQFYQAFFAKYLGDIGMSNKSISIITIFSVALELPFLLIGDKLYKKTTIWNWVLLGVILNTIRWLGLGISRSLLPILLFEIPTVTVMAVYEFMPALYLGSRVQPELKGSAQSMLNTTTFCVAKVVGSLLGGVIADVVGISAVFIGLAVMQGIGICVLIPIVIRMNKLERAA